ncbi:MAG TPA: hypothetical protein VF572_07440 [Candidatus Saccharimonadales bacterium]|jgi:hypothetical protein
MPKTGPSTTDSVRFKQAVLIIAAAAFTFSLAAYGYFHTGTTAGNIIKVIINGLVALMVIHLLYSVIKPAVIKPAVMKRRKGAK